jgi:hypothetical protein
MSKHTPGPWVIRRDSSIETKDGETVASFVDNTQYRNLIAAAPELLAALKAASEWLNDMGCEHEEPDLRCVVCLVNAAINKAEGR